MSCSQDLHADQNSQGMNTDESHEKFSRILVGHFSSRASIAEPADQRGYLDVGQALSELPAFGVQPSSAANTQNGFGIAQRFVDLYSLGSQRTLVLVDGRRVVSESTSS